ncbi:pyridoxal-phosphate dependent enzyme [Puniceicoccaceae bacterium K14]|nr:pyridoxal-phosphate dependent enzyme [Puniceicoccaceae bacterium K14]
MHPLRIGTADRQVFIKREDELSSGVIGSKLRKYSSLIPALLGNKVKQVGLIGGSNSNNCVAAIQLLKEVGIDSILFLREAGDAKLHGNSLFTKMLCPPEKCIEIDSQNWPNVNSIVQDWAQQQTLNGEKTVAIAEGAFHPDALPGAISLASDIVSNEREHGTRFDNIYIDSGTGLSAIGLLLGLSSHAPRSRNIIITLIAGTESEFRAQITKARQWLPSNHINEDAYNALSLTFLRPPSAASYGSINKTIINKTISVARQHGLLMDPIYSIKHFMAMEEHLQKIRENSSSLFIYNGGSLGLAGFQGQLASATETYCDESF